jgi:hypothetical protein
MTNARVATERLVRVLVSVSRVLIMPCVGMILFEI